MKKKKERVIPCQRCGGCCEASPCLFSRRLAEAVKAEGYSGPLACKTSTGEWYVPREKQCPHYSKIDGVPSCALFEYKSWSTYWKSSQCGWPNKRKPASKLSGG